ncbi:MAG: polysaccharide pyruvyl transferase family protein [Microthrixaceae bacterium]
MEKGQQLRVAVLSATLGTLDASGLGRDEALAVDRSQHGQLGLPACGRAPRGRTGRPGRLDRSARRSARAIRRDRDPRGQRRQPAPGLRGSCPWIERCDRPVVVVGLGAQAASSGDDVSLTPGTVAYLRALSERTEVLGVRGEFSAATLARIGVSNTLVMGCPSNFIAPNATLGSDLEPRYAAAVGRVTVAAGSTLRHLKSVERQLYRWMARSGGLWFPQSGPALELWPGWGGWSDTAYRKVRDYVTPLAQRPLRRGEFDDVVSRRLRVLLDVPAWMNELRTCDAAFGTRFHGNMLAFPGGRADRGAQPRCAHSGTLRHDRSAPRARRSAGIVCVARATAAVYRLCRRRVR